MNVAAWTQAKAAHFDTSATAYRRYLIRLEHEYDLPNGTLLAQMMAESGGHGDALSDTGAEGLFQFMPGTAQRYGINPWNPYQSARAAARYLAEQSEKFGTLSKALAAYNAGPKSVSDYGGIPPYAETVSYVRRILSALPTARDSNTLLEAVGGVVPFSLATNGPQADRLAKAFFNHRNYANGTIVAAGAIPGSAPVPTGTGQAPAPPADPRLAGGSPSINPLLIASDL